MTTALAVLIGGCCVMAVVLLHLVLRRMGELRRDVVALAERVKAVENGRRHTHRTCAGIEDALAVMIDESRLIDSAEFDLQAARNRLSKANEILKVLRSGPQSYEPETPAGRR